MFLLFYQLTSQCLVLLYLRQSVTKIGFEWGDPTLVSAAADFRKATSSCDRLPPLDAFGPFRWHLQPRLGQSAACKDVKLWTAGGRCTRMIFSLWLPDYRMDRLWGLRIRNLIHVDRVIVDIKRTICPNDVLSLTRRLTYGPALDENHRLAPLFESCE